MTEFITAILKALEAFGTWIIRDPNAWWIFILTVIAIIIIINLIKSKRF